MHTELQKESLDLSTLINATAKPRKATYLFRCCAGLLCLSGLINSCVFIAVPNEPESLRLVPSLSPIILVGVVFLVTSFFMGTWVMLAPHLSRKQRMIGFALLLTLIPLFRAFQLYTNLGVFILNGSKHWIAQAASTNDPTHGKLYLGIVLSATQYGVNEAENQILDNYAPPEQARLFALLADIAPNETWKERYRARSLAASWRRRKDL